MKFSVLMSVYNNEKSEYLEESIKSILSQTLKPNEFIIIEDGILNYQLENVIKKYEENPIIKIYRNKENKGLGECLKQGVNLCSYDYIARMDSDDVSLPNRFEKQIKYLKQNPKTDILGSWIQEYDEKMEKKQRIKKVPINQKEIEKEMKRSCPFNHSTVILRKSKLLEVGNYKNIYIEDYELWIRMFENNAIMHNLDEVLLNYRAGIQMYKRRSGLKYIKKIKAIENDLLEKQIINTTQYFKNMTQRTAFALMPDIFKNPIRKLTKI